MKLASVNIKIICLLTLCTFPYNNFPYFPGGTLKPLCIFVLPISLLLLVMNKKQHGLHINKYVVLLACLITFYISLTLLHMQFNDSSHYKLLEPSTRFIQFLFYSFITMLSFSFGVVLPNTIGVSATIKYVVYAFIPSLTVGLLQIITNNGSVTQLLRKVFASTDYPNGYYRIHMLTTEPSWASFDLCAYIIPCTWYLFSVSNHKYKYYYLLLLFFEILLVVYTKSALGILLVFTTIAITGFYELLKLKKLAVPLIVIALMFGGILLFVKTNSESFTRLTNIGESIREKDAVEESAATRLISYSVGLKIFRENLFFGVGFRMAGYHYPRFVEPEMELFPLVQDWVDPRSARFPDIKSFVIDVLASSGIVGSLLLAGFFLMIFVKFNSSLITANIKTAIMAIIIVSLVGSFSMNLYGYPLFWLFCGLICGMPITRKVHSYKQIMYG